MRSPSCGNAQLHFLHIPNTNSDRSAEFTRLPSVFAYLLSRFSTFRTV